MAHSLSAAEVASEAVLAEEDSLVEAPAEAGNSLLYIIKKSPKILVGVIGIM
jgi:hypothetical protein